MITIKDSYFADVLEPGEIEKAKDVLDAADRLAMAAQEFGPIVGLDSKLENGLVIVTVRLSREDRTIAYSGLAGDVQFLHNYADALRQAAADTALTAALVKLVIDRTRPRWIIRDDDLYDE